MTRLRLSTTMLLLCFLTTAFGQLQKGDWMLDLSGSIWYGFTAPGIKFGSSINSGRFNVSAGKFLTDKFLIGSGFGVSQTGYAQTVQSGQLKQYRYELNPFVRYYFYQKNHFASFAYAQLCGGYNAYQDSSRDSLLSGFYDDWQRWDYLLKGGIGLDFFIAPNVALEGLVGLNWMGKRQSHNGFGIKSSAISLGIRTFLSQKFENKFSIKDQYLLKSNRYIGISTVFRRVNQSILQYYSLGTGGTVLDVHPGMAFGWRQNVNAFINDRLVVGGACNFSGTIVPSKNYSDKSYGLSFNVAYHIPLTGRIYFVPAMEIAGGRSVLKQQYLLHTIHWDSLITVTPEGPVWFETTSLFSERRVGQLFGVGTVLQMKYFTGWNAIFDAGYQFDARLESNGYRHLIAGIFVSFEYFFAPNLSFTGRLNYQISDGATGELPKLWNEGYRQTGFSFGMNYFIFN